MDQQESFAMVRSSPLADELEDDECRELARLIRYRHLRHGEVLIAEGTSDNALHVILGGKLAVTKETGGGDQVVLHLYRPREIVGELGFIDGTPHSATLRAEGDSEVFTLERSAFESLLATNPQAAYRVMKAIIRAVHAIVRRMNVQYVELTNYITKQHGKY